MICDKIYKEYLNLLLEGKRIDCGRIVQDLMDQGVEIKTLYSELFQKSLYTIGELWELNRISVAKEHMATAITEGLLNLIYPRLFKLEREQSARKVIISCAPNEFHQIGGKMVADLFQLNGWDSHFLGANTPIDDMLEYIQDIKPDLVGLSLSVYLNMPSLIKGIEAVRTDFKDIDIVVGGQAFNLGGMEKVKPYSNTVCIRSLVELDDMITVK